MDYGEDIRAATPLQIEAHRRRQAFRNTFAPVGKLGISLAPVRKQNGCDTLLEQGASPQMNTPESFSGNATRMAKLICRACSHAFSTNDREIMSKQRTIGVVFARQVAFWIARELTEWTLPEIGSRLGGRDRTTVYYALKKLNRRIETDGVLRARIESLRDRIVESIRESDPKFAVPAVRKQYVPEQQGARERADTDAGSKSLEDGMRLDHQVAEAAAV